LKRADIILTAPKTEMSEHHEREFLGFGACTPVNVLPRWMIELFFYPKVQVNEDGVAEAAPYGLRKIEAVLKRHGFDVVVVHPDYLPRYLKTAKVLGISAMDPLGLGPASATFKFFFGDGHDPATAYEFKEMMSSACIREFKRRGGKIILGGPGSWQVVTLGMQDHFMIDTVVIGEAEEVAPELFQRALEGEELPRVVEAESPEMSSIPTIVAPSVNGLVEVSRGCGRGCKFCSVALRARKDFPLDHILREVDINARSGRDTVILHAEDVLQYGAVRLIPSEEKVLKLFRAVKERPGVRAVTVSHMAFSSVAAKPSLIRRIAETLELGYGEMKWMGVQMGIETGSPRLIEKYMAGKAYPFKPSEWPEVVVHGYNVLAENKIVPACTLIIGLPGETEDDIIKTIELVDRVFDLPGLIVPLIFVPMHGIPLSKHPMLGSRDELPDVYFELGVRTLEYDLKWTKWIFPHYTRHMRYAKLVVRGLMWLFIKSVEFKLRRSDVYRRVKEKRTVKVADG